MIITEGNTTEEIINYFAEVEDICKRHGAIDAMVPNSERAKRKLIHAREQLYPALKRFAPVEVIDTVVPRSQIAVFMKQVKKIAEEHGVPIIGCGHAGDGNVHLHPICINMDVEVWRKKLPAILRQVYEVAISLGGAISGEHGIGIEKKDYLEIEMNQEKLDLMRRIKKAFDPNNILNPGKIF